MDQPGTTILALLMLAAIIFGIILAIMMICLPFFVARIRKELIHLNVTMDRVAIVLTHPDELRRTVDLTEQAKP